MTPNATVVSLDDSLAQCSKLMHDMRYRHLPVVQSQHKLTAHSPVLGVISSRDLVRQFAKLHQAVALVDSRKIETVFNNLGRYNSAECEVGGNEMVIRALELMSKNKIAGVFVHDRQQLAGIFTETDYLTKIAVKGRSSFETRVRDVMTTGVKYVNPEDTVDDLMRLMADENYRVVPVLSIVNGQLDDSPKNSLVGVIMGIDVFHFLDREKFREVVAPQEMLTTRCASHNLHPAALPVL